ncbi:MAG: hypothetical protein ACJLUP_16800 [Agrobacterium tumefaciens]
MFRDKFVDVNRSNAESVINCYGSELWMDPMVKDRETLPSIEPLPDLFVTPTAPPNPCTDYKSHGHLDGSRALKVMNGRAACNLGHAKPNFEVNAVVADRSVIIQKLNEHQSAPS